MSVITKIADLKAQLALLEKVGSTFKKVEALVKQEGFESFDAFLKEYQGEEDKKPSGEKRTRTPITAELLAKLKADTEAKMTIADIAAKHGIAEQTYTKYRDLNFVFTPPKPKGRKKAS
jgi:hypothetical protein